MAGRMTVSKKGLVHLASHEGIVQKPYFDSVGVLTIGIGHTKNAGGLDPSKMDLSRSLSLDLVMEMFATDIKKYEKRVNDAVKVELSQHQFDALVSFDYNTGGIYEASLTKSLNKGDYKKAGKQIMNWNKPKEIIPRRKAEQDLFLTGVYKHKLVNVYDTNNNGKVLWNTAKRVDILPLLEPTEKPAETIIKVDSVGGTPNKPATLLDGILWLLRTIFRGSK